MKRIGIARLHIGLVIAKAIYKDREHHLADLKVLREGRNGVGLARSEKLQVVKSMLIRAGKSTGQVWLPPAVLWGLGIVTSSAVKHHEAREDKSDLARAKKLARDTDERDLVTLTREDLNELRES